MAVAVVLAAGTSSRLGQPKALLSIADSTLVGLVVSLLSEVCDEVIVVTRSELQVDVMLAAPGARVVVNPHPEAGRTGSIQVGLMALEKPPRALIVPVDRPAFTISVLHSLLATKRSSRPVCDGRGGHPVNLSPRDIEKVLAASPSAPLRELVRFTDIPVQDADFSLNVDTPADLAALEQWYEAQGR